MNKSIILCGVGGQGTVLASRVLAQAAMNRGEKARTSETIGMAQRGGCVVSHVRIGEVKSALVPIGGADLMIAFEPSEAVRSLLYLKKDAVVVVSSKAVQPVTAALTGKRLNADEMIECLKKNISKVIVVDADKTCNECGSAKVLNVALLGAAVASGKTEITYDEIKAVLKQRLPAKVLEMNMKALELGAQYAK